MANLKPLENIWARRFARALLANGVNYEVPNVEARVKVELQSLQPGAIYRLVCGLDELEHRAFITGLVANIAARIRTERIW